MLTRRFFTNNSISIEYAESADNGTPIVVLHGLAGRWQENIPLFSPLTFNHKIYALSLRGHGNSFRAASYTIEEYTEDIIAFIKQLPSEKVTLLAHSLGGLIALNIASKIPALIRATCVIEPLFYSDQLASVAPQKEFLLWKQLADEFDNPEIIFRAMEGNSSFERIRAKNLAKLHAPTLDIENGFFDTIDREKMLETIESPVHLIYGNPERGGSLSEQQITQICGHLKNWSKDYLEGCGHYPQNDRLSKTSVLVTHFLESF